VRFEFIGAAEVTEGMVEISAQLWFAEFEGYYFYVRQQGGASASFNTIYFHGDGDIGSNDAAGSLGTIGQYETGRAIELRAIHDLDAGTYDIWWDGVQVVEDRAHGIAAHGVGGVYFGIDHDADLDGVMYLDDLLVVSDPVTAETQTWSDVKVSWH